MDVLIRKADSQDVQAITDHNCGLAEETEGKVLEAGLVKKGVSAMFGKKDRGFYLMAEVEGKIAGSLMITYEWSDWRNKNMWWFQSVYVRKEFREKGVFSKLYEAVVKMAKQNEVSDLRLYVDHENKRAQKVYDQLGMHQSHYLMYEIEISK